MKLRTWQQKTNSEIQKFTCAGLEDLGPFLTSFHLFKHQMGTGEHKLTNAMGISLLKDKLSGINELKAAFALWTAGKSTDLDTLLQAIEGLQAEYLEEIEGRNARKVRKAAAVAQANSAKASRKGKKGQGKGNPRPTCSFAESQPMKPSIVQILRKSRLQSQTQIHRQGWPVPAAVPTAVPQRVPMML